MATRDEEDDLLRSVALQNASSILVARQRAEQELIRAKDELEAKTAELAHSLSMMRATLESTTDGILVTDERGTVTGFNKQFAEMWRIPAELMTSRQHPTLREVVGQQFEDSGKFLLRIEDIYASSPPESLDVLELANGRVFERFSKIQSVNGRTVGRVWSFRDITERRRAEVAAQEAAEERKLLLERERTARTEAERASAMKDDFLATLSHELRTPLSAILGWSHMIRHGLNNPADVQRGLEIIERNARVQTQLIEDLLDMSRITSGKVRLDIQPLEPESFVEAAIETVRPAAEAKGIKLEKRLDSATGPILGDPGRLQQVVWNLLSNAIKFTPKDGKAQVLLRRVNSNVEIRVSDTGIGINPDFLQHVFERFRQADHSATRSHGGLGLGLAIVKSLVEMHGGTVSAESSGMDHGTTFVVRLPVLVVHGKDSSGMPIHPKLSTAFLAPFERADLSGIKVIVVDDEADARNLLQRVLQECGAEALTACGAAEAVELVERERPDVLVTDIGMPEVDGYELLRRVRALGQARGGKVPAVALTAFARSEDRTRALRAGFLVHIAKPVEPSELVATIASIAGRTGTPPE